MLVGMQLGYFSQPQLTSTVCYPKIRVPVMYSINHLNDEPHQLQCIGRNGVEGDAEHNPFAN